MQEHEATVGSYWIPQQECQRVTTLAGNHNRALTDYLDRIAKFYATHQRDNQRELAYMRASAALKAAPCAVKSGDEAMHHLPVCAHACTLVCSPDRSLLPPFSIKVYQQEDGAAH